VLDPSILICGLVVDVLVAASLLSVCGLFPQLANISVALNAKNMILILY